MKHLRFALMALTVLTLSSCSSDPQLADPETYEKTEQLQKQYGPFIVGTWYNEHVSDRQRFFEKLTFQEDGTLTGYRKWQSRSVVTIGGEERYTDWEDVDDDTFTGRWQLYWEREGDNGSGANRLMIIASFDSGQAYYAYSLNALFRFVDATTLNFDGGFFSNSDGTTNYTRGDAEPSF